MTSSTIDAAFVEEWSARYDPEWDATILNDVHPRVNAQGFYTLDDAQTVITWKSRRSKGYLKRNEPDDVEAITKLAFKAPPHLAHRVLGVLHGVGDPVASALLMVYEPDTFTVIDRYAIHALRTYELWPDRKHWPPYPEYVEICQALRERCGCTLRTLDRALWAWGEANGGA